MNTKVFAILVLLFLCHFQVFPSSGNDKLTAEQYIALYKDDAIKGMINYKIPASITLAQGMLESGNGNSLLAVKANNHFGIKCHNDWDGKTIRKDDDKKNECFRKYSSVYESFEDHAKFLTGKQRYASLFELDITDYKGWAHGLKKAGYATNPKYPQLLINIIERYELYQYDSEYKAPNKEKSESKDVAVIKEKKKKTKSPKTTTHAQREIYRMGIKKYVIVKQGDTFYSIAKQTDKDLWQLYKYNDLTEKDKLIIGEKIFLQPKRNKAKIETHTVKAGETMRYISQLYGVKIKSLYKKNNMKEGEEPKEGDIIYMRNNKPNGEDF